MPSLRLKLGHARRMEDVKKTKNILYGQFHNVLRRLDHPKLCSTDVAKHNLEDLYIPVWFHETKAAD